MYRLNLKTLIISNKIIILKISDRYKKYLMYIKILDFFDAFKNVICTLLNNIAYFVHIYIFFKVTQMS